LETGERFLKKSKNKLEWYDAGEKDAKEKVRAIDVMAIREQIVKRLRHYQRKTISYINRKSGNKL
jgi:hypothetical protein